MKLICGAKIVEIIQKQDMEDIHYHITDDYLHDMEDIHYHIADDYLHGMAINNCKSWYILYGNQVFNHGLI